MRPTTLLETSSQSEVYTQSYGAPKSRESQLWEILGLPFRSLGTKYHLNVGLMERHRVYSRGEGGGPLNPGRGESCESEFARGSS
jgi:hypothetical protein